MVRKFDVRPLNLHGLSGRGFVFKNVFKTLVKGLYYKNYNISYLLSIVIFTPPTLHLEKGKHVSVKFFVQMLKRVPSRVSFQKVALW